MSDLRPCPLCGGEAMVFAFPGLKKPLNWIVRCRNGCVRTFSFDDGTTAIETWNHRYTDGNAQDKKEILGQIDDIMAFVANEVNPIVSPEDYWVYSNLYDDLEQLKITCEQKFNR